MAEETLSDSAAIKQDKKPVQKIIKWFWFGWNDKTKKLEEIRMVINEF